ncbi:MAG: MFS transporter [Kiritimatiellia bacterium]
MKRLDYKWTALILLWVAFFLQQGTRQLFGPSVPAICGSLGVDKVAIGTVGTVFAMMYGFCVPFAGVTADLLNRKWMVTIGVAVFCLGIFLSGFAASVGLLVLAYGILNGFGQTFYYPSATSLVSQLHQESRATAISILQLGLYVGIVGCGGLAGWLAGKGGASWRTPFWIFGGLGLVWALVLAVFLKDTRPATPPMSCGSRTASVREAVSAVIAHPVAVGVILGFALMIYVDIGFKNWMPTHLQTAFRDGCPWLRQWAGLHAVLWHYLGAALGVLAGSRIGDRLVKKRAGIRLELGVAGLGLAIPFIIWMSLTDSFVCCCAAMFGFGIFRGVYDSNFMASFLDVVNPRHHASAVGIMMCVAFLFGSLSSTVLPWIAHALDGNMAYAMSSLAIFYLAGALVILLARLFFLKRDKVT